MSSIMNNWQRRSFTVLVALWDGRLLETTLDLLVDSDADSDRPLWEVGPSVLARRLRLEGTVVAASEIETYSMHPSDSAAVPVARTALEERLAEDITTARLTPGSVLGCRLALTLAHCLLPRAVRDEALFEWHDEIESAAALRRPVARRTASIVLRAAPRLAWQSRVRSRARRKGG